MKRDKEVVVVSDEVKIVAKVASQDKKMDLPPKRRPPPRGNEDEI